MHVLPQGEEDLCPVYKMTKPLSREELYYFRKPVNLIRPHLFLWASPTTVSARQLQGILVCKRVTTCGWNLHLVTNVWSVPVLLWVHNLNGAFLFVFCSNFSISLEAVCPSRFSVQAEHSVAFHPKGFERRTRRNAGQVRVHSTIFPTLLVPDTGLLLAWRWPLILLVSPELLQCGFLSTQLENCSAE